MATLDLTPSRVNTLLIALVDKPKPAQRSETQQNTQGRPYWALITTLQPASWGLPVGVKSMN